MIKNIVDIGLLGIGVAALVWVLIDLKFGKEVNKDGSD